MKALVVLSGGQDSTTCLSWAIKGYGFANVHAITFAYGQKHVVETQAALAIARRAGIDARHKLVYVGACLEGTSPLVNPKHAVESYAGADALPGGLEKTFVPMRNMLFLTLAANRAVVISNENDGDRVDIITGVSQEDYGGYPDCRFDFIDAMQHAIQKSLDDAGLPLITLQTPLLNLTKKETVELSEQLVARELLELSHTCYNGQIPPCGTCHACLLRAKGYAEAGVEDPLIERLRHDGVI